MKKTWEVHTLVRLSLLSAVSLVLIWVIHIPIFPSAPFLEYDPADMPVLIAAFLYGPWLGLAVTVAVSLLQWLLISIQSGPMGAIMHVFATGGMVIVAGLIYRHSRTLKGAIIALICGSMTMTLLMIPLNLIVTPIFMGAPVQAVIDMLPVIVSFNAIKAFGNSLLTFLLYKRVGRLLEKIR